MSAAHLPYVPVKIGCPKSCACQSHVSFGSKSSSVRVHSRTYQDAQQPDQSILVKHGHLDLQHTLAFTMHVARCFASATHGWLRLTCFVPRACKVLKRGYSCQKQADRTTPATRYVPYLLMTLTASALRTKWCSQPHAQTGNRTGNAHQSCMTDGPPLPNAISDLAYMHMYTCLICNTSQAAFDKSRPRRSFTFKSLPAQA